MRQVLGAGALRRPRGIRWRGRWERGSGWGTHVNPWPIHVNVWQKPLQYCRVISLQLIKINGKKNKKKIFWKCQSLKVRHDTSSTIAGVFATICNQRLWINDAMKSSGWESLEKSFPCFQKLCSTADRWTWHKFPKISTNNWASGNIEGWVQVPPGSIKTNEKKKKKPQKMHSGTKDKGMSWWA